MAQCCGRQAPGEQLACRRVDGQRQGPFAERRGPLEPRAGHPVLGDLLCPRHRPTALNRVPKVESVETQQPTPCFPNID
jgi:hypothetical protein